MGKRFWNDSRKLDGLSKEEDTHRKEALIFPLEILIIVPKIALPTSLSHPQTYGGLSTVPVRCGTTEHFLLNNTCAHGLRLIHNRVLSLCFATKYNMQLTFISMNTHTYSLSTTIIKEDNNCTI